MTDVERRQLVNIAYSLHRLSGFNPESFGWPIFTKIIQQRMAICAISDMESYARLLEHSEAEKVALIEATVIPETWFFRDASAFSALPKIAKLRHNNTTPLRILSLPCASGEEPYSIVIALLEAGFMPNQFRLDAADISTVAIAKARQAIYTDNAFRGLVVDFRPRYFTKTAQGYKLQDSICDQVYFSVNNLFSVNYPQSYDIIFCRNLLIYFDHETVVQAFSRLYAMLAADGFLFLGHAEAMYATRYGMAATAYANIFSKIPTMR